MALRQVNGDVVLAPAARTATTSSDAIAAPGAAILVLFGVHITAVSGTTPTLVAKLQQSNDNSTWSDIVGTSLTQLTAAGGDEGAGVATDDYVRVVLTIGGTSPSFTCAAWVMLAAE